MREILFRGKRIDNGEWVEGAYYIEPYTDKAFIIRWNSMGMGFNEFIEVARDTVGQYTILRDKNEKMIFEGDVVKCKHTIHTPEENQHIPRRAYDFHEEDVEQLGFPATIIVYLRNYTVKCVDGEWNLRNGCDGHRLTRSYIHWHNIEIIGNIHDNPELLKGE